MAEEFGKDIYSIYNQDVFQINDINFLIPPQNINIQMEDLVYQSKALRTKASTKTPSGHGNAVAQVQTIVKYEHVLDLIRLVAQIRNSPYCFVENRLLRETIVPDWPLTQNMAFTCIGLSVAPLSGSSDALIMQLDLQWFNYKPYTHNFLYRDDWMTEWLWREGALNEDGRIRKTIGWDIDPNTYERTPRTVIIATDKDSRDVADAPEASYHREWNTLRQEYANQTVRTIEQIEALHPGEFYDLLPPPDRMSKAQPVVDPKQSRIYVRYSNFLMRDALLMNFGIDVEKEMEDISGKYNMGNYFFTAARDGDNRLVTLPLNRVPAFEPLRGMYRQLARNWIDRINSHHGGTEMLFCIYKDVSLPEDIKFALQKVYSQSAATNAAQYAAKNQSDWYVEMEAVRGNRFKEIPGSAKVIDPNTGDPVTVDQAAQNGTVPSAVTGVGGNIYGRVRVRPGLSNTLNTHVPVGNSVQECLDSVISRVKYRPAATVQGLYNDPDATGRMHWGTDFKMGLGEPVYAVKPGLLKFITSKPSTLYYTDLRNSKPFKRQAVDTGNSDQMWTILEMLKTNDDIKAMKLTDEQLTDMLLQGRLLDENTAYTGGTAAYNGFYIWQEYSPNGKMAKMYHTKDGSQSAYVHLSAFAPGVDGYKGVVVTEDQVREGFVIGYVGGTGPYNNQFITDQIDKNKTKYNQYDTFEFDTSSTVNKSVYQLGYHLHFEYWEKASSYPERTPIYDYTDGVPLFEKSTKKGMIPVNIDESLRRADPSGTSLTAQPKLPQDTRGVLENLKKDDNLLLNEEEIETVLTFLEDLNEDGWMYYQEDEAITNVWYKVQKLDVLKGNADSLNTPWRSDSVILTNMGGGIRHVVSNIPILGHEFPTNQHLGSIEPFYTFEFCSLDDNNNLDGISQNAQMITGMRSVLQYNARMFRPIIDGWALSNNTFITRLFDSYREGDIEVLEWNDPQAEGVSDYRLKRRLICTSAMSSNVEGNPGLTAHIIEMSETNPYADQPLNSSANSVDLNEESRRMIIEKLYNLDFADQYKGVSAQLFLAAAIDGVNFRTPDDPDFGIVELPELGTLNESALAGTEGINAGIVYINGQKHIALRDADGSQEKFFRDSNLPVRRVVPADLVGASDEAQEFIVVDVGQVGEWELVDEQRTKTSYQQKKWSTEVIQKQGYVRFDVSKLASGSQLTLLAANVPWQRIVSYKNMIEDIRRSAEIMLFEDTDYVQSGNVNGTGTTLNAWDKLMYGLPGEPKGWRYVQEYILNLAKERYEDQQGALSGQRFYNNAVSGSGLNSISSPAVRALYGGVQSSNLDTNWLSWNRPLSAEDVKLCSEIYNDSPWLNDGGAHLAGIGADLVKLIPFIRGISIATGIAISIGGETIDNAAIAAGSGRSNLIGTSLDVTWASAKTVANAIARKVGLTEADNNYVRDWYLDAQRAAPRLIANSLLNAVPLKTATYADRGATALWENVVQPLFNDLEGRSGNPISGTYSRRVRQAIGSSGFVFSDFFDGGPFIQVAPKNAGSVPVPIEGQGDNPFPVYLPHAQFNWDIDAEEEARKLEYFHDLLARIADRVARDPDIIAALGLPISAESLTRRNLSGRAAYPDIVLPFHPYYGNSFAVSPDFYFWNIYQDGGARSQSLQEDIERTLNHVVANAHASMQKIQNQNPAYVPGKAHPIGLSTDNTDGTFMSYHAEGSEGMTTMFYETSMDEEETKAWELALNQMYKADLLAALARNDAVAAAGNVSDQVFGTDFRNIGSSLSVAQLKSRRSKGVRLSVSEGYFGVGRGVQYPARTTNDNYDTLKKIWDGMQDQQMFGHRKGFLKQKEVDPDLAGRTEGTNISQVDTYNHKFDLTQLQRIAKESSKDVRSQKMMMRRAYPTFKLYFIEEDEYETRLLNFDDFYSYNGVMGFTTMSSRKSPADHAIITVQNIAGTLDGTRRDAITDLDYFSDEMNLSATYPGNDPSLRDSDQDQPFGSIVLRPGINVQLRVGFSNNPDELEVLINGRVVDVTWNKQMDQAEIMVQSFGTELIQDIKGTSFNNSEGEPFYTTHELLGTLMMEPELVHFGRWEFGQRFQQGENNDYRLDFHDYTEDTLLGKLGWSKKALTAALDHPWLVMGVAAVGIGIVGSRFGGRIPGINTLLRKSTTGVGNGAVAGALQKLGLSSRLTKNFFLKRMVSSASSRLAAKNAARRAAGQVVSSADDVAARSVSGATRFTGENIDDILKLPELEYLFGFVRRNVDDTVADATEAALRKSMREGLEELATNPNAVAYLDDAAELLAKEAAKARNVATAGPFILDPLRTNQGSLLSAVGGARPFKHVIGKALSTAPMRVVGTVAAAGLGLDIIQNYLIDPIVKNTAGRARKYFQLAKVALFMNPQDDNLFVPHPKDYMRMPTPGQQTFLSKALEYIRHVGISALTFDQEFAYKVEEYMSNRNIFDKTVRPEACQYIPDHKRIWDIFHEMSLRHPGWIYAARPYGKEFRYTMFFGVPSQRYWSRPASNEFIDRVNLLYDFLQNGDVSIPEYRRLYGDNVILHDKTVNIDEFEAETRESYARRKLAEELYSDKATAAKFTQTQLLGDTALNNVLGSQARVQAALDEYRNDDFIDNVIASSMHAAFTARALQEYLEGVQLRFQPFRRYHLIDSERDLSWNGIMGTENASYNAVDVTYYPLLDDDEENAQPGGTELFKAHSRIPEHRLRVHPMQNYRNCKGYKMAMRYGLGQLLHDMREVYRGEIIVLGNPRIRPWDIAVLNDHYNDMAGPIEVDHVVHHFSHETGFITEIKPGAVVIANETSSYPVLVAMKALSFAIKDIELKYSGQSVSGLGIDDVIDTLTGIGSRVNTTAVANEAYDLYLERYGGKAGIERALDAGDLPNWETVDDAVEMASGLQDSVSLAVGAGAAGLAYWGMKKSLTPFGFGGAANGSLGLIGKISTVAGVAGGAVGWTLTNGAIAGTAGRINPQTAIWLLGGPIFLLNALRGDSIIMVPLMKSGEPIIANVNFHDPASVWNDFKGEVGRYIDDYLTGTRDVVDLWRMYGTEAWRRLPDKHLLNPWGADPKDAEVNIRGDDV